MKLIDLSPPNQIICIYDIKNYDIKKNKYLEKIKLRGKDDYLNNRILNCCGKEMKDNCELFLKENKIDFCEKYQFPKEGKYIINIIFEIPLINI